MKTGGDMDVTLTLLGIVLYLSRDDCHHTVSAGTEHPTIRIFAVPKHRNLSLSHNCCQGRQDVKSRQTKNQGGSVLLQTDSALVAVLLTPPRSRLDPASPMFLPIEAERLRRNCTAAAVRNDSGKDA
jgi:hypothetical protein